MSRKVTEPIIWSTQTESKDDEEEEEHVQTQQTTKEQIKHGPRLPIPVYFGYESKYYSSKRFQKQASTLDPDGDTMKDAEGERAIIQVPPLRQYYSPKKVVIAILIMMGAFGVSLGLFASFDRYTGSAFDFHDGANYGYQDTAVGEEDITTATPNLGTPVIAGDVTIPNIIDKSYIDMFQTAEDGSLLLTPYERMSGEVPVFFRVPNSGARLESVLSGCVKAVLASTIGAADGRDEEDFLRVVNIGNRAFVNVDLSQTTGIERASQLALGASGLADVFVSPHLHYTANQLLSYPGREGRMFTVLRHPVERAIARHASFIRQHQPDMPDADATLASMSLVDWAQSEYSSKNWLIRFLVNKRTGLILAEDVQVAKEILRKKCLIGLYDRIWTSMERVERYFGWFKDNQIERECHQNQIAHARERDAADYMLEDELDDASFDIGSEAYELLVKNNDYDMEVYWYAVGLFDEQGKLFPPSSW